MAGENNLDKLLQNLSPLLVPGQYVFCTTPHPVSLLPEEIIGSFRESEGPTFILSKTAADDRRLPYDCILSWITLQVHSSLDAVGLTAAVSAALTGADISCNIVAAYYHDHLFVPEKDAAKALDILQQLSIQKGGSV